MATQATLRLLTSVLLLLVPFLLPLAGCDNTMPAPTKNAMPAPNEPPPTKPPAGTTWTVAASGALGDRTSLSSVAWGGGRYVAVGIKSVPEEPYTVRGVILRSTDEHTWTAASGAGNLDGTYLIGVRWSGTRFFAFGGGITRSRTGWSEVIVHSADGDTWTAASVPGTDTLHLSCYSGSPCVTFLTDVAGDGTRFVAVGFVGTTFSNAVRSGVILRSTDGGDTWTAASVSGDLDGTRLIGVRWVGGRFVALGIKWTSPSTGRVVILRSTDGDTWTAASGAALDSALLAVTRGGGRFVALGIRPTSISTGRVGVVILHSTDGDAWTAASGAGTTLDNTFGGVAWGDGRFVVVGSKSVPADPDPPTQRVVILHSTDGDTWTAASVSGDLDGTYLIGVTWSGTRFVAVGSNGSILTSP